MATKTGQNSLSDRVLSVAPHVYAVFASIIFLDSLRYKFTNAPETQTIFGKLDAWTTSFGAPGLFAQTGLFSQYVIGSAELVAALLLLWGILPSFRRLQTLGMLVAFAVMSGAVSFHLFTPLGIDPNNDGGGLFMVAVIVWIGAAMMLVVRYNQLLVIAKGIGGVFREEL
ncbi:MAG: hypothetical protein AAF720_03640 [Pseudomonadota bacterium]